MPYTKRKEDWVNTTDYIDESDVDAWEQATYELKTLELDPRDFGATTASLDNSVAFQAMLDAIDVGGTGIIKVPPGTWKFEDTLTIKRGRSTIIRGCGQENSMLRWNVDLGAGEYAIACASAFPSLETVRIENLTVRGPGGAPVTGEAPCDMRGIEVSGGVTITDVRAGSFYAGFVVTSNHAAIRDARATSCFYGLYFDVHPVQPTVGNHTFDTVTLQGTWSAMAIHPQTSVAGSLFNQVHWIDSPYAIYRETGSTGARVSVGGCMFSGCSFETIGHALFYDEDADGKVDDNSWVGCGFAVPFSTGYRITGQPVDYWIRSGFWTRNFITASDGTFFSPGDLGVFESDVVDMEMRYGGAGVTDLGAGVQPVEGSATRMIVHTGAGRCSVVGPTVDVLENDLLVWSGTRVTKNTTYAPAGVAVHDCNADDTVLMCTENPGTTGILINTSDATITANEYVKQDTVNAGQVVAATGPTDGAVVGWATQATSGGSCRVRLRGL